MYKTIEERYYNPKISVKNKIGALFALKVQDLSTVKKHIRVRRNLKEKAKLDRIEKDLIRSPRLIEVEGETENFEEVTSQEFTETITDHFNRIKEDEQKKIIQKRSSFDIGSTTDFSKQMN